MSKLELKEFILKNNKFLTEKIMEQQMQLMPELKRKYNSEEIEKSKRDTSYNLNYLAQAIIIDEKNIFSNYYKWLYSVLKERGMKSDILKTHLLAIKKVLNKELNKELKKEDLNIIDEFLTAAEVSLKNPKNYHQSFIREDNILQQEAEQYLSFLIDMERDTAVKFILKLVEKGVNIEDIYLKIFQPVQYEIGRFWQLNKISIAQEHYATSVTQLAISQLYPKIFTSFQKGKKALTTCIGSELHELGIRMVADLLELNGWDTIHLGSNTPVEEILNILVEKGIDLLALSVTLADQLDETRALIKKIEENENLSELKIMVGGRLFMQNENLWQKIGADGFAINAKEAVKVADSLL